MVEARGKTTARDGSAKALFDALDPKTRKRQSAPYGQESLTTYTREKQGEWQTQREGHATRHGSIGHVNHYQLDSFLCSFYLGWKPI